MQQPPSEAEDLQVVEERPSFRSDVPRRLTKSREDDSLSLAQLELTAPVPAKLESRQKLAKALIHRS